MTLGEQAPDFGTKPERMRQHLKDDVALGGPEAVMTQGGQAQRMPGVVREIEATLQGKVLPCSVLQPRQARSFQGFELLRVGPLLAEVLPRPREVFKRRWHFRSPSARS